MNYLKALILILFFQNFAIGQNKRPDEFIEFKDVWMINNWETPWIIDLDDNDAKLLFNAVFDKDSIGSFVINLNYTCPCTPALDRSNEIKRITEDQFYYQADYTYTSYTLEAPKKKRMGKIIPVQLWVNRANHKVILKINDKIVADEEAHFSIGFSINPIVQKNGTALPSAASIH
ncbi:hypothetical protein [Runella sp.]|uniref:hypothetical protein n=1 Tax=Runella sp. TaxID=1960881 RepID=UPI003D1424DA